MKKVLFPLLSFVIALSLHILYSVWHTAHMASRWVGNVDPFQMYFAQQSYFVGISYALAASFTAYAVIKFVNNRKGNVGGVVGGITLTSVLYFGGCFLAGCCGSPMLAVYLGLFGPSIMGFAKPITLISTIVSIVIGYVFLNRKRKDICCDDACCWGGNNEPAG